MIPLRDDNSLRLKTPVVTYGLILLNVLAFFYELAQPDIQAFITRWGVVPREISEGRRLETLITSMFLHGGWAHLIGNMLFLHVFGDNLEDRLGRAAYLAFYLACGVAAGLAQVVLAQDSAIPGVGASGAISGVLAGYVVLFGSNRVLVLLGFFVAAVPAYLMIGAWIVMQLINGYASVAYTTETEQGGVAYGAHIGGFVAGLVLVLAFRGRGARRPGPSRLGSRGGFGYGGY